MERGVEGDETCKKWETEGQSNTKERGSKISTERESGGGVERKRKGETKRLLVKLEGKGGA